MAHKALWYIAGGRKFSIFYDWAARTNYVDKLIVRNHLLHEAHEIARNFFLKHKEYDYFIMSSDDVLGTADHVQLLIQDEEKHSFPVISGWCNVLVDKPWAALSMGIEPKDLQSKALTFESYHFLLTHDIILDKYGYPFFKVWFTGQPLTLLRREVLEKISLREFRIHRDIFCKFALDPKVRVGGRGCQQDVQFAIDCEAKGIPIMVDTRVFLLHFGFMRHFVKVGIDPRRIDFIKATNEESR